MTGPQDSWRVTYARSADYQILNCQDLLDPRNPGLLSVGKGENSRRFVVVDEEVQRLYGEQIRGYFDAARITHHITVFPGGEQNKSIGHFLVVLRELDAFPVDRRDEPLIAIGGGVVTDVMGFVAGTYRRGLPYIKVPTTLLGYVDASVGVKTGINFNGHKNRIGTFTPPQLVLLDRSFLKTLPHRHILNGVGEILKLAVIADAGLFELLEQYGVDCIAASFQDEWGGKILDRAVGGMVEELAPNLFEDELTRTMDFGHTFSYGLEMATDSSWLHGEAVLADVLISAVLAARRSLLSQADLERIFRLVSRLGIELDMQSIAPGPLWRSVEERTLHRNGYQRIPLPQGIGQCGFLNDVTAAELPPAVAAAAELYRG